MELPLPSKFIRARPRSEAGEVPLRTLLAANALWFTLIFHQHVVSSALVFTLRRLQADIQLISALSAWQPLLVATIGAYCSHRSDRVWTRFGRRSPFVIVAFAGAAVALAWLPRLSSLGAVAALFLVYSVCFAVHTPLEALYLEMVPRSQRGLAFALRGAFIQVCTLYYFQVLFPLSDSVLTLPAGVPLLGGTTFAVETLIYGQASVLLAGIALYLAGVRREVPPVDVAPGGAAAGISRDPLGLRRFLVEVFGQRRWWPVYLLYCCNSNLVAAIAWGGMGQLLLTEQLGLSRLQAAATSLPGMVLTFVVITPVIGWYSDRKFRVRAAVALPPALLALLGLAWLGAGAGESAALPLGVIYGAGLLAVGAGLGLFFAVADRLEGPAGGSLDRRAQLYRLAVLAQLVLAGSSWLVVHGCMGRPGLQLFLWIVVQGMFGTLVWCSATVSAPLVYDYLPAEKLGTLSAGFGLLQGIVFTVVTTGAGLWIAFWSFLSGAVMTDFSAAYLYQLIIGTFVLVGLRHAFRRLPPPA